MPSQVEDRAQARPGEETYLTRHDDPEEMGESFLGGGVHPRGSDMGQFPSHPHADESDRRDGKGRPGENGRKKSPALFVVPVEIVGQKRNESDRKISSRKQIIDEIGDHEGREVQIGFPRRAE